MNSIQIPIKSPVTVNPQILGGTPVIDGTRIPASLILELLAKGYPKDLIVKEYPTLTLKKVDRLLQLIASSLDAPEKTL